MKAIKSAVSLTLILYLCVSVSGVLFVFNASAKITPKETDEPTGMYGIKKGDTLWHLAEKYRNDPLLWREFEKYNIFTNPHLIYPEEQLQVSAMWGFPGVPMSMPMPEPEQPAMVAEIASMAQVDMLKKKLDAHLMATESALQEIGGEVGEVHEEVHGIQHTLAGLKSAMDMGGESLSMASMTSMENKSAIAGLNESVMGLSEGLKGHAMEWEKQHMEHAEHIDGHLENIENSIGELKATQDEIGGKVDKLLHPDKKMKSKKRPIAFLTALIGGAAWVAMNSLGDRE
jgi:hypothetical protein